MRCTIDRERAAHGIGRAEAPAGAMAAALLDPIGVAAWSTADGGAAELTIYSLVSCPALVEAVYVLVRREDDGSCTKLGAIRAVERVASLNLARVRHEGARLGANEVHVCAPMPSAAPSGEIERHLGDDRTGAGLMPLLPA